jgi:hypothetical protein
MIISSGECDRTSHPGEHRFSEPAVDQFGTDFSFYQSNFLLRGEFWLIDSEDGGSSSRDDCLYLSSNGFEFRFLTDHLVTTNSDPGQPGPHVCRRAAHLLVRVEIQE